MKERSVADAFHVCLNCFAEKDSQAGAHNDIGCWLKKFIWSLSSPIRACLHLLWFKLVHA